MSKVIFSAIGGIVMAAALSILAPNADAACQGYCADLYPGGGVFAGCSLHLNQYGQVIGVDCSYSFPAPPGGGTGGGSTGGGGYEDEPPCNRGSYYSYSDC